MNRIASRRDVLGQTATSQESTSRRSSRLQSLLPKASDDSAMDAQNDNESISSSSSTTIPELESVEDEPGSHSPTTKSREVTQEEVWVAPLFRNLTYRHIIGRDISSRAPFAICIGSYSHFLVNFRVLYGVHSKLSTPSSLRSSESPKDEDILYMKSVSANGHNNAREYQLNTNLFVNRLASVSSSVKRLWINRRTRLTIRTLKGR